jgi:hypothetical protein
MKATTGAEMDLFRFIHTIPQRSLMIYFIASMAGRLVMSLIRWLSEETYAYIVVNNSGKIEVTNQATLVSVATITGLISPRNISFINDYKAYVSSLYSDSVAIINLTDNSISGYINLRRSSETIAIIGNKAFISYWTEGKRNYGS